VTESVQEAVRERSTWTELFYDLVLVFAVTQAAQVLAEHPGWASLGRSLLILAPLWWAWVGMALLVNAVAETPAQRLLILAVAAVTFIAAVAAPRTFTSGAEALLFAVAYLIIRVVLAAAMHRKASFPVAINPYTVGIASGAVFVAGAALPPGARELAWAAAVAGEMVSPAVLGRRLHGMRFEPAHAAERFGILIIIALGESVVSSGVVAARSRLTAGALVAVVLAVLLGIGLWWLYFNFGASAIEHALRTHKTQAFVVRDVLGYGHFVLLLGLLAAAVGTRDAVAHPSTVSEAFAACLLPAGTAMFVLTFGFTRWRMFGAATWTRAGTGLLLVAVCAVAPLISRLAGLAVVVVIVAGLNIGEYWLVASGRQVPLLKLIPRAKVPAEDLDK
jgi:low temperature requirement protein LtrA